MVRSGWSINSWRAFSPTMISPLGVRETMLGTMGRTSGRARFIHATRLLVVPRSIPTTLSLSNSIWNIGFCDQVRYVFPSIQQASHGSERFTMVGCIPISERLLQFGVEFHPHAFEALTRTFQLIHIGLLDCHVQLENFFEELRRNVFRGLLADVEALKFEQVLRSCNGVAQS